MLTVTLSLSLFSISSAQDNNAAKKLEQLADTKEEVLLKEDGSPAKALVTRNEIKVEPIYFNTGAPQIRRDAYAILNEVVDIIKNYNGIKKIRIEGHTDNVGDDIINLNLSEKRASNVRKYILSRGISADRIESQGFGEAFPLTENKTAEGRAKNRRVQFIITQKSVRFIEQMKELEKQREEARIARLDPNSKEAKEYQKQKETIEKLKQREKELLIEKKALEAKQASGLEQGQSNGRLFVEAGPMFYSMNGTQTSNNTEATFLSTISGFINVGWRSYFKSNLEVQSWVGTNVLMFEQDPDNGLNADETQWMPRIYLGMRYHAGKGVVLGFNVGTQRELFYEEGNSNNLDIDGTFMVKAMFRPEYKFLELPNGGHLGVFGQAEYMEFGAGIDSGYAYGGGLFSELGERTRVTVDFLQMDKDTSTLDLIDRQVRAVVGYWF